MKRSAACAICGHRGGPLVTLIFTFTAAAYNIVQMRLLATA
jgi:hypothetical protein